MSITEFREIVWGYYQAAGRDLPWRAPETDGSFDAYKILVSEVMLQQTQASRVVPKYQEFLRCFPTVEALSRAELSNVLLAWSGLGYNRRAKYLHEAAKQLAQRPQPWSVGDLAACKGVGHNTAAAVIAYSYNQPVVFIETNIRTVFIHHFFKDSYQVHDKDILPLVEEMLDHEHPREWYWALMDYGAYLKVTVGNASRASKHYTKQSTFQGSKRQLRGHILRLLGEKEHTYADLETLVADERLQGVLDDLLSEGLISSGDGKFSLG